MKYRFCGNQDVPDWLLREVSTLSKISCVRLKLICRQVVSELLGGAIDFAKVQRLIPKDKGFRLADVKAALAALNFILVNATRNDIDHMVLNQELQQLGLPKENSDGISRPFRRNKDLLRQYSEAEALSFSRLTSHQWRVDCILGSSVSANLSAVPVAKLRWGLSHGAEERPAPPPPVRARLAASTETAGVDRRDRTASVIDMELTADKLLVLRAELARALALMEEFQGGSKAAGTAAAQVEGGAAAAAAAGAGGE